MSLYYSLAKLGRTKLPSGTTYALIDVDGRAMIAPNYSASAAYQEGDHVIMTGLTGDNAQYNDNLFRAKTAIVAGAFDVTKWDMVTVDSEIKRLEGIIAGGIHYRGKTTTALYDGATTNPITISGGSYTAEAGDLVIVDLANVSTAYAVGSAYGLHAYVKNGGIYYITNSAITAGENTSFSAIEDKLDVVKSEPEFLYDGAVWALLGSMAEGLGDLAYKDTATGSYVKPTGSGSVTIKNYSPTTQKLSTTTVTGTDGTVDASKVSVKTTKSFAVANENATTVATADAEATKVGNADVDTAVAVGTSLTGTTTFNTDAIKSASLTGTKTFNTDAIKSASLTGTKTFNTDGVKTSVNGDCLEFVAAATGTVGIETAAASTGTVGIETAAASTASVTLGTTNITPAKAVSASSATVRGVSGTTNIRGVSGTDTAITELTITAVTPAKVAASATTVATGSLEAGSQIVTGLTSGTESATVSVGTESATVTVK